MSAKFVSMAVEQEVRRVALDLLGLLVQDFRSSVDLTVAHQDGDDSARLFPEYDRSGGLARLLSREERLALTEAYCREITDSGWTAPRVGSVISWAPSAQIVKWAESEAQRAAERLLDMNDELLGRSLYRSIALSFLDPYDGHPGRMTPKSDVVLGQEAEAREYGRWAHRVIDLSGEGRPTKENLDESVEAVVYPVLLAGLTTMHIVCRT